MPGRSGEAFELNQVPMTTVMPMINASTARSLPKLIQLISLFFSKFLRCRYPNPINAIVAIDLATTTRAYAESHASIKLSRAQAFITPLRTTAMADQSAS